MVANELYARCPFSGPNATARWPEPSSNNYSAAGWGTWMYSALPDRKFSMASFRFKPVSKPTSDGSILWF